MMLVFLYSGAGQPAPYRRFSGDETLFWLQRNEVVRRIWTGLAHAFRSAKQMPGLRCESQVGQISQHDAGREAQVLGRSQASKQKILGKETDFRNLPYMHTES